MMIYLSCSLVHVFEVTLVFFFFFICFFNRRISVAFTKMRNYLKKVPQFVCYNREDLCLKSNISYPTRIKWLITMNQEHWFCCESYTHVVSEKKPFIICRGNFLYWLIFYMKLHQTIEWLKHKCQDNEKINFQSTFF